MSIVAVSCQTRSHQAYGAFKHFILFQSVGRGKDGKWWIAAHVIFCIEKFLYVATPLHSVSLRRWSYCGPLEQRMVELCWGWYETWDVFTSVGRLHVSRPVNASWDFWVGNMVLLWFKMLGHKEPIHNCDMECLNVPILKMFSNMIHCCNACMLV